MTDKDLKRLRRDELLEMLIAQSKRMEQIQEELDAARAALASREILLQEAGSIAEASLRINGVFEAAQAAAQQYLENIRRMSGALPESGNTVVKNKEEATLPLQGGAQCLAARDPGDGAESSVEDKKEAPHALQSGAQCRETKDSGREAESSAREEEAADSAQDGRNAGRLEIPGTELTAPQTRKKQRFPRKKGRSGK